jgi:hypothetical protein
MKSIKYIILGLYTLLILGCASNGKPYIETYNHSGRWLPAEYRETAYTEQKYRELDALLNTLNTPDKVDAWTRDWRNFQYDYMWYGHSKGTKHPDSQAWRVDLVERDFRPPIVLYATKLGVCHELSNFAANALMRAGY